MPRTSLDHALERMRLARRITRSLLEDLEPEQWHWQPGDGLNHIAWNVGHIAFAQYFLCLKRVRDRTIEDESLITTKFLKAYKQGSRPRPAGDDAFAAHQVHAVFEAVYERATGELSSGRYTDASLDRRTSPPHPLFTTKLGAINWCPQHEMMHAGQIALLRRLLGKPPTV
ncbi:MAG: DinB family protein [Planctomycetota bacterium]